MIVAQRTFAHQTMGHGQSHVLYKLAELRARAPKEFAPLKEPSLKAMPTLKWRPGPGPSSKPDGNAFSIIFVNKRKTTAEIFWITPKGKRLSYGLVKSGETKSQQSRPGAAWEIVDTESGETLGHCIVGDRKAKVVIPR